MQALLPLSKGYTLVELLVVIAVISVLAGVGISAINPTEQFNRARDSQRKADLNGLAKALISYQANNNNTYPTTATMVTALTEDASVLKQMPSAVSGTIATPCTGLLMSATYCYNIDTPDPNNKAIVYTVLQSSAEAVAWGCKAQNKLPYAMWRSADEKFSVQCLDNGTTPGP